VPLGRDHCYDLIHQPPRTSKLVGAELLKWLSKTIRFLLHQPSLSTIKSNIGNYMLIYTVSPYPESPTKTTIMSTESRNIVDQNSTASLRVAIGKLLGGNIDENEFKTLIRPLDLTIASAPPNDPAMVAVMAASQALLKGSLDAAIFEPFIGSLNATTDTNFHNLLDSRVLEATKPIESQSTQPYDYIVPTTCQALVTPGTADFPATAKSQYPQQPNACDIGILEDFDLSKKQKKKKKKNMGGKTKIRSGGECVHLLCTACYRLWTASKLDSMISRIAPDYHISGHEILGTTRCPNEDCGPATTSIVQDGNHRRDTICFPLEAVKYAREKFGVTHVPIVGWGNFMLYLAPDKIAALTVGGGVISSKEFPGSNSNT
jgi:hypothetical protein